MKVAVFTSNQPRHISLVNLLARVADQVTAVLECNSIHPWASPTPGKDGRPQLRLHDYFQRVLRAEREVFGEVAPTAGNVRVLALRMGDASQAGLNVLAPALDADLIVVFGASYLRGELADALVARKTVNVHMGISPYYRGSGTNFWPLYDGRPDLVGATIHLLSKGLDSGDILFHAAPKAEAVDSFLLGMKSVRFAHEALAEKIQSGELTRMAPVKQDKSREIRYTRGAEFTEEVAGDFLARGHGPDWVAAGLEKRDPAAFVRLVTG